MHMLAIKPQRRLESFIPPAIAYMLPMATRWGGSQELVRELCGALSVEVVVELAPGPPYPSEVG